MLMRGQRRRRSGWPGGKARGGGRAPEAGEDDAEENDGEEADARSMGIRSPGGRGRSGRKLPAFRGPTAAYRWRGGGEGVDRFRETGDSRESRGVEDGGAVEGSYWGG
jgi:hypothetical protein